MIELPKSFPARDYTPHGYLDNPYHTAVLNRSGVVRSVPPTGMGYWCRAMPWPYGMGTRRQVNYLSFLHPSVAIDGVCFHTTEDFGRKGVSLVSRYHTKNAMTYDWSYRDVDVRLLYHLVGEHTLRLVVEVANHANDTRKVTLHATNIYGYPEVRWWGSDGIAARRHASGSAVSKFWAYGDVFVLSSDLPEAVYGATASRDEWDAWMESGRIAPNDGASSNSPDPVYSVLSGTLELAPGEERAVVFTLTRGVNEPWTVDADAKARAGGRAALSALLAEDEAFYASAPLLEGDWPEDWKCGWVYDLETIRQNVRRPVGIYKHHWDAMQVFTPRSVLAESVLDALTLSYGDIELAKDVILGTFADALMPNVPASREDGSVNVVSMGGEECGTAPIWVLPFYIIRALYDRTRDDAWASALYPQMEAFVEWWLENRTDETGRFFCNNSWESGQDGSKRFLLEEGEEGKEAEYVQTVDVEAAMADAMRTLACLAPAAGRPERAAHWQAMADRRAETTRAMYVDGWFRDFDARTGKPIILPDYLDVMMLLPLSVGIATEEQTEAVAPKFEYFVRNPKGWLEWPSFMFCYTEAGQHASLGQLMADVVGTTADRVYGRTNAREVVPIGETRANMPAPYNHRIPGTSNEYWPIEPATLAQCGSEAYGWGATLPALIIRNIAGFREADWGFILAPTLPESLLTPGRNYTVTNLSFRGARFDVTMAVRDGGLLDVTVTVRDGAISLFLPSGQAAPLGTPLTVINGTELRGTSAGL